MKREKAISSRGSSFQGELEAIFLGTEYAKDNINDTVKNIYIYSDSQSAIKAITGQSRESYHHETIGRIRESLTYICDKVENINLIYCPAHKGIQENEMADALAKTAAEKARHLPQNAEISMQEIKKTNKELTLEKWKRRWENTKSHKYKQIVPAINDQGLKQRSFLLKHTSRKVSSKILRLKSGHCMLNSHKNKIDKETQPNCDQCQVRETPEHFLLHCSKFEEERRKLLQTFKNIYIEHNLLIFTLTMDDILGEQSFSNEDLKALREALEIFIKSTKKDI